MRKTIPKALRAGTKAIAAVLSLSLCGCGGDDPARPQPDPDPTRVSVAASNLSFPAGLAVDASGRLFVAEYEGDRISLITGSGTIPYATGIKRPVAMTAGPGDTLFATTEFGRLYTITPGGDTSSVHAGDFPLGGVARAPSGRIFAADPLAGRVIEIGRDGSGSTLAEGFEYPAGLEIRSESSLYVSSALSGTVAIAGFDASVSAFVRAQDPPERALDIRRRGDFLYIADNAGGVVWRTAEGGGFERYIEGLAAPIGLAFRADTLYVSSSDRNVVYRVIPPHGERR